MSEVIEPTSTSTVETSNGSTPRPKYASADELLTNAPLDIIEEDVKGVFGGLTIRVRSLTAAQAAQVKQRAISMNRGGAQMAWAQMEVLQFEFGVIEPKLTHEQVVMLHRVSGPSFAKVIEKLDEMSGIGKEELRKAQEEFQES